MQRTAPFCRTTCMGGHSVPQVADPRSKRSKRRKNFPNRAKFGTLVK
jgi:hypothetical protein